MPLFAMEQFFAVFAAGKAATWPAFVVQDGTTRECAPNSPGAGQSWP